MSHLERVVVVGSSGSGKTSVARALAKRLDAPLLEMDAIFHARGWADVAHEEFLPTLDEFTTAERWIVDGNYTMERGSSSGHGPTHSSGSTSRDGRP